MAYKMHRVWKPIPKWIRQSKDSEVIKEEIMYMMEVAIWYNYLWTVFHYYFVNDKF